MSTMLEARVFDKQLLRWRVLTTLQKALPLVQVICDEGYFEKQALAPEKRLARAKDARGALFTAWKSIDDEPKSVDMNIQHFFTGNRVGASFHEKLEYDLQIEIFKRHKIKKIQHIVCCNSEQFSEIASEFERYRMSLPLAFMAVYRASR